MDKVLFGTDSPWGSHAADVERMKKHGFSDCERELIFWRNAMERQDIFSSLIARIRARKSFGKVDETDEAADSRPSGSPVC